MELRLEASGYWQQKDYEIAVELITQSIRKARMAGSITYDLVEGYDDAGLYYFDSEDYKNSAKYQSIAVVLYYYLDPNGKMNEEYQKRLGWAFRRYNPDLDLSAM